MNTTLLVLTASSRLLYGMATLGAMPALLSRVSTRQHAPVTAIIVATGTASLFVLLEDLTLVASVTDVAVYLVFLAVNASVIVLRRTMPEHERPMRIPGTVARVPLVPVLAFVVVLGMLTQLQVEAIGLAGVLILAGALVYALRPKDATRG
jgi:amino acid transporter